MGAAGKWSQRGPTWWVLPREAGTGMRAGGPMGTEKTGTKPLGIERKDLGVEEPLGC